MTSGIALTSSHPSITDNSESPVTTTVFPTGPLAWTTPSVGATAAASAGLSMIKPDEFLGSMGGRDVYSEIEITPGELEIAATVGVGGVAALVASGCSTWWSGVGAGVCAAMITATDTVITESPAFDAHLLLREMVSCQTNGIARPRNKLFA